MRARLTLTLLLSLNLIDHMSTAGDASKIKAVGPGLERSGNPVNKLTYFEVDTKGAGKGVFDVVIMDPLGHKNSVRPTISKKDATTYIVKYIPVEPGLHSVHVSFAGSAIPNSPFGVGVSPACKPQTPPNKPHLLCMNLCQRTSPTCSNQVGYGSRFSCMYSPTAQEKRFNELILDMVVGIWNELNIRHSSNRGVGTKPVTCPARKKKFAVMRSNFVLPL